MAGNCDDPVRKSIIPAPNLDPSLKDAQALIPTLSDSLKGIVDDARQLLTDFGLRPYTAHSIILRWTGGSRGRGDSVLVSERALLPTPGVLEWNDMRGQTDLRTEITMAGTKDVGAILLHGISGRYTEDDVNELFFVHPLPEDHEGFIELRKPTDGAQTSRRRYAVRNLPYYDPMLFEWRVSLEKADADRSRAGKPFDVELTPPNFMRDTLGIG